YNIDWEMGVTGDDASDTIETGDTGIWTWTQNETHSVVSDDPNAPDDSGSEVLTGEGQTYEYTFTEAAIFDYNCGVHTATMIGTITVKETMSVADKFIQNINYYPNPVQDNLTITSLVPVQSFRVFNTSGKQLIQSNANGQTRLDLALNQYQKGLYFVEVISTTQQKTTLKVIKK